ncbi:MAG: beta-ketoacyl synthase N-terminal-like domain-containing protein [Byssovorax sp.]
MARPEVMVTGLGAVTAFGWGIDALRAGLRAGQPAFGPIRRFDASRHRTQIAAEVPPRPAGARAKGRDRSSHADRFAVAAAREAVRGAALDAEDLADAGLFFSSSAGGMREAEAWMQGRAGGALGVLAAQQVNAPGDAAARDLGLGGPVVTTSSACASAAMAIGAALDALRSGEVEIALAGGADALCQTTFGGFNTLRAVDARPCRPFRADRAGLSLGEGAGVLVLETFDHAERRGARPRAILAGAGTTSDAHHMNAPDPSGDRAGAAVSAALADAGIAPADLAFINLHGTGTEKNDEAEHAALRRALGPLAERLPATSTKSLLGHLLGAAGAVEAIAALLDLEDELVHPTAGEGPVDPRLSIDLVLGAPRAIPGARAALSLNLGFGGANAALVFLAPGAVR